MKKNYANKDITVSKEEFEKPKNLSIKVDCWSPPTTVKDTIELEQSTEEFEL